MRYLTGRFLWKFSTRIKEASIETEPRANGIAHQSGSVQRECARFLGTHTCKPRDRALTLKTLKNLGHLHIPQYSSQGAMPREANFHCPRRTSGPSLADHPPGERTLTVPTSHAAVPCTARRKPPRFRHSKCHHRADILVDVSVSTAQTNVVYYLIWHSGFCAIIVFRSIFAVAS